MFWFWTQPVDLKQQLLMTIIAYSRSFSDVKKKRKTERKKREIRKKSQEEE